MLPQDVCHLRDRADGTGNAEDGEEAAPDDEWHAELEARPSAHVPPYAKDGQNVRGRIAEGDRPAPDNPVMEGDVVEVPFEG